MRVLLVTHRYPPDGVGGVERYVERLRAALEESGDALEVTRTPRRFPRRPRLIRDDAKGDYSVVKRDFTIRYRRQQGQAADAVRRRTFAACHSALATSVLLTRYLRACEGPVGLLLAVGRQA